MTTKERIGFVTVTLAAAFVGGAVSGHIFAARTVDAAAAAPRMITAQKFMLVDSRGKTRGEFNVTKKGVAQIAVFDGSGTLRAGLGVGSEGAPALGIYGIDGKPRIEVGLTRSVARVVLFDQSAKPQATLGVAPDGQSGIGLMDKAGNPRASIIVATDGTPTLRLGDENRGRIGMDLTPDGRPGLALIGTDGKTRASLTLNTDGAGALTLFDASGSPVNSVP
ncbi:MAG TPA: hypothetical protein VJX68_02305 [Candidatus Binatus sp.]|uniref:hypothetical protein n=1 Tax=Candidatus Binatus sp. TaxID=2811406 RepID=UPI002B4968B8|nr:hypothetical protein [Candidatus Binatus sp.]HKN12001.1 hypothetical protein [Candidatus Binatus sp.]